MNPEVYLAHFPKITFYRYRLLKEGFFNWENFYNWELSDLTKVGWHADWADEFISWRERHPPKNLEGVLNKQDVKTVSLSEDHYPRLLKEIADPPLALFYRGIITAPATTPAIAVVGTRQCTPYGKEAATTITTTLAKNQIKIISGLAIGIDAIAHSAALDAGGITWAVLGTEVADAFVSPRQNLALARKIIDRGGAIISEYAPGAAITKFNFPARNRIVAGLTLGTLVVEAPEQSGALITARLALDYNREVFAVPHPFNAETGVGCNQLIKAGAHLITTANDILEALNIAVTERAVGQAARPILSAEEEKIFNLLQTGQKNIDEIIVETGLAGATINSTLVMMEIKGIIKNFGAMTYGLI